MMRAVMQARAPKGCELQPVICHSSPQAMFPEKSVERMNALMRVGGPPQLSAAQQVSQIAWPGAACHPADALRCWSIRKPRHRVRALSIKRRIEGSSVFAMFL